MAVPFREDPLEPPEKPVPAARCALIVGFVLGPEACLLEVQPRAPGCRRERPGDDGREAVRRRARRAPAVHQAPTGLGN